MPPSLCMAEFGPGHTIIPLWGQAGGWAIPSFPMRLNWGQPSPFPYASKSGLLLPPQCTWMGPYCTHSKCWIGAIGLIQPEDGLGTAHPAHWEKKIECHCYRSFIIPIIQANVNMKNTEKKQVSSILKYYSLTKQANHKTEYFYCTVIEIDRNTGKVIYLPYISHTSTIICENIWDGDRFFSSFLSQGNYTGNILGLRQ